ncbi:MAG: uracil-DNA glycosylase family protein [Myxococcaceae bacterium]
MSLRRELAQEIARHLQWQEDSGLFYFAPAPAPVPETPVAPASAPQLNAAALRQKPRANPSPAADAGNVLLASTLDALRQHIGDCQRCKLCSGRTQVVFGVGNPSAELMFVGEGPGEQEDLQGVPFVGKAGQLLTKMIEAMGFVRDDVYIANVVKCRPPNNRNPEPDEIESCEPFLRQQIALVKPKVLVALGKFAAQTLLREATPISRLRGHWREYEGVPLMPTFHPAYLLRNPPDKKFAWEDLQQVMRRFGRLP